MFSWFKRKKSQPEPTAYEAPVEEMQSLDLLRRATDVCAAASRGDLEARLLNVNPSDPAGELARSINHLLDMTDAFVREATASLQHAASGKFFRRVLLNGMLGTFRTAADSINKATSLMDEKTGDLAKAEKRRLELEHEIRATLDRVKGLETTLEQIDGTLKTIQSISMQANLLALNSGIEAARVGEAGKGFSVVAQEVRALSNRTADAAKEIQTKVESIRSASKGTAQSIDHIWKTIRDTTTRAA
jgi:methyl-accepting chemotaxis protein